MSLLGAYIFYFHKQYNLLYAFIFCLLFYITFDLVNQTKENMQTSTIKIENVDNAVGVLKKLFGYNQDQNLQINNDLGSGLETVSLENNENKI